MIHELKISDLYFDAVLEGRKRFELRANDRDYRVGDTLLLSEINPFMIYTGRWLKTLVLHVFNDTRFGLPQEMVILSIGDILENGKLDVSTTE